MVYIPSEKDASFLRQVYFRRRVFCGRTASVLPGHVQLRCKKRELVAQDAFGRDAQRRRRFLSRSAGRLRKRSRRSCISPCDRHRAHVRTRSWERRAHSNTCCCCCYCAFASKTKPKEMQKKEKKKERVYKIKLRRPQQWQGESAEINLYRAAAAAAAGAIAFWPKASRRDRYIAMESHAAATCEKEGFRHFSRRAPGK